MLAYRAGVLLRPEAPRSLGAMPGLRIGQARGGGPAAIAMAAGPGEATATAVLGIAKAGPVVTVGVGVTGVGAAMATAGPWVRGLPLALVLRSPPVPGSGTPAT